MNALNETNTVVETAPAKSFLELVAIPTNLDGTLKASLATTKLNDNIEKFGIDVTLNGRVATLHYNGREMSADVMPLITRAIVAECGGDFDLHRIITTFALARDGVVLSKQREYLNALKSAGSKVVKDASTKAKVYAKSSQELFQDSITKALSVTSYPIVSQLVTDTLYRDDKKETKQSLSELLSAWVDVFLPQASITAIEIRKEEEIIEEKERLAKLEAERATREPLESLGFTDIRIFDNNKIIGVLDATSLSSVNGLSTLSYRVESMLPIENGLKFQVAFLKVVG
jgi:hypothetical protein